MVSAHVKLVFRQFGKLLQRAAEIADDEKKRGEQGHADDDVAHPGHFTDSVVVLYGLFGGGHVGHGQQEIESQPEVHGGREE